MSNKMVIQQPNQFVQAITSNRWSSNICDCTQDMSSCCFAFWCFPCFSCITAREAGECLCLPLLDSFGVIPPATMSMRVGMRQRYGIEGTMCNDCVYSFFCGPCTWFTMATNVIINNNQQSQPPQPQTPAIIAVHSNQWSTGICGCFDDLQAVLPTGASPVSPALPPQSSESVSVSLCWTTYGSFTQLVGVSSCTPPVSMSMRVAVRNRYGIQGDMMADCVYSTFCNICSWCQMAREIKRRRQTFTVINAQSAMLPGQNMVMAFQPGVITSQPMINSTPQAVLTTAHVM
ncbi:unnamed protein product [Coregonus sp. 'balchen']|nr:unnamed protein product [Coregonus sp. 'balchen']